MLKSIYTPLSGALAQERVLEIIANNLANASTTGFKSEKVSFKLLEPEPEKNYKDPLPPANYKVPFEELLPLRGNETSYVGISGVSRDMSQGSAVQTKNPLDLMLEGDGFFSVQTREGVRYTRNGAFTISAQGALVDQSGAPVLGGKGNIFVSGKDITVNELGEVYQDGEFLDKLSITKFKDQKNIEKVGMNHYLHTGLARDAELTDRTRVRQGCLEGSNVNTMKNLTDMILAHRSYEGYQQAIKNYDSMMEKSSNSIGEVRG